MSSPPATSAPPLSSRPSRLARWTGSLLMLWGAAVTLVGIVALITLPFTNDADRHFNNTMGPAFSVMVLLLTMGACGVTPITLGTVYLIAGFRIRHGSWGSRLVGLILNIVQTLASGAFLLLLTIVMMNDGVFATSDALVAEFFLVIILAITLIGLGFASACLLLLSRR